MFKADVVACIGRTGALSLALTLSLVPVVYAANKFPDYPIRQARDYAVTAEQAGLIIGIQPVEDIAEQKTYFHTD
jgi:hypothetical protein